MKNVREDRPTPQQSPPPASARRSWHTPQLRIRSIRDARQGAGYTLDVDYGFSS